MLHSKNLALSLALAGLIVAVPVAAKNGSDDGGGGGGTSAGSLRFDEASFEVAEGAGNATITVERSGGETGAVSVGYSATAGTATAGDDFTPTSGTLSWADGDESPKTFTVAIVDDSEPEGPETILLALDGATGGAVIGPQEASAVLIITANDGGSGEPGDDDGGDNPTSDDGPGPGNQGVHGVFKLEEKNYPAIEGSEAVITVERDGGEEGEVSVSYSTEDGSATVADGDYTATSGVLTWLDGEEGTKVFMVPIIDDGIEEPVETVHLHLSDPIGGAIIAPGRDQAQILIGGNDEGEVAPGKNNPGVLRFEEKITQVLEGNVVATVLVERSKGSSGPVTVDYATADGSATDGSDYMATSGTLSWASGEEGTKSFDVQIFDDSELEGNETVQLALSNPLGGATLDPLRSASTLVIVDDDGDTTPCVDDDDTLCLDDSRFRVEVKWQTAKGESGSGTAVPLTDDTGTFWFFTQNNREMLIKVLDACQQFDRFWVFFAATTDVSFTVEVTDTETGVVKQYQNPLGQAAQPEQDTLSFDTCP